MKFRFAQCSALVLIVALLGACSEARKDPCVLLLVEELKSIDEGIETSLWAGRDGERKEDEVCGFYTSDGEPRAMLFVWYDMNKDPLALATQAAEENDGRAVAMPVAGGDAAAYLAGNELRFLAVRSDKGVVGIRVRKSVKENSTQADQLVTLSERALQRKD